MGRYDAPALVEKVNDVTGKKVTWIGYSNGTAQMNWSLASPTRGEDYWDDKLNKFIALAACIHANLGVYSPPISNIRRTEVHFLAGANDQFCMPSYVWALGFDWIKSPDKHWKRVWPERFG